MRQDLGQKHGSLLHARGSQSGGGMGHEPSTFFDACKAMEIDASPDFCHLDVTSFETALPLCRAVDASDCTQISELSSQCDPALLNSSLCIADADPLFPRRKIQTVHYLLARASGHATMARRADGSICFKMSCLHFLYTSFLLVSTPHR